MTSLSHSIALSDMFLHYFHTFCFKGCEKKLLLLVSAAVPRNKISECAVFFIMKTHVNMSVK